MHKFKLLFALILGSVLVISLWLALPASHIENKRHVPPPTCDLAVLAAQDDPYYPLAIEIATAEKAPLVSTLSEALACEPQYLLWVVSPNMLSDRSLIDFGRTIGGSSSGVSPGILTASTLDRARRLWAGSSTPRSEALYAINAANQSAHIPQGQILSFSGNQATRIPLDKNAFIKALGDAGYLTFTGHGGSSYLRLDEDTTLRISDLPDIQNAVIAAASCQTFQPWKENSIALGLIDRGALTYAGFLFSPNEGYVIGEFNGLPFRFSTPGFPTGRILQVQNRGTLQGFAFFPYMFQIGDPRLSLQDGPGFLPDNDIRDNDQRILTYTGLPAGVLPIHIANGASYSFVNAAGLTAAADEDPFYNSRLQMVNVRGDKYVLVDHPGGDLTLRLSPQAPWYWFPLDILTDSLDHTLIFLMQSGSDYLSLVFCVLPLLWLVFQYRRRRISLPKIARSLPVGLLTAILLLTYTLSRLGSVTITSKAVTLSLPGFVAVFLLGCCAAILYNQSRRIMGKAIAVLVFTFPCWSAGLFTFLMLFLFNLAAFAPRYQTSLYNYSGCLLTLVAFIAAFLVCWLILEINSYFWAIKNELPG